MQGGGLGATDSRSARQHPDPTWKYLSKDLTTVGMIVFWISALLVALMLVNLYTMRKRMLAGGATSATPTTCAQHIARTQLAGRADALAGGLT